LVNKDFDNIKVHGMTVEKKHTHSFIIFNSYCFSTATISTRTGPHVTLYVHCLPWTSLCTELFFTCT